MQNTLIIYELKYTSFAILKTWLIIKKQLMQIDKISNIKV